MLPEISFEGALTTDPEVRFTRNGKAVSNFSLACRERVRGAGGEWTDGDPSFIDVTLWGKPAENLAESARRGDMLVVTGTLKQEHWETSGGEKRSKLAVTAHAVGVSLTFNEAKTPRATGEYVGGGAPAAAPAADDEPPF